ncbi:copper chaperone for superoxide dismutase-like [Haliotis rufescens]|uniref:copper chaperone for superoxide dismutase-like n=1 Tax=Haliotis rufescens TaxID=6454 RepID=UPI00201F383B|nr:copper chaperone for superoxide dismutase-like [Haliotis rufescens]
MATPTKMEFAVQMTCQGCVNSVRKVLDGAPGINSVDVLLDTEQVIVESSLPSSQVKDLIEITGKRAVLQGYGSSNGQSHLGAAVAIMEAGSTLMKGVVRLVQTNEMTCVVEGTVDGLPQGTHTVCVHELGDLSRECKSCGDILGLTDKVKGIVTELKVGEDGRGIFRSANHDLKVWNLIGRSMIIHQGPKEGVIKGGNSNRMVCGIIARSAGLFENNKKICACDGVTIWEERDKPLAGQQRQDKSTL